MFILGNYQEAIKDFSSAIDLNPNHDEAYRNRGLIKMYLLAYRDAESDLSKALEINPNSLCSNSIKICKDK